MRKCILLKTRPTPSRLALQATLKDRQCNNEQTEKTPRQPTHHPTDS
jgi:hypothetical protein